MYEHGKAGTYKTYLPGKSKLQNHNYKIIIYIYFLISQKCKSKSGRKYTKIHIIYFSDLDYYYILHGRFSSCSKLE